jgi:hypothetical protein
MRRVPFSYFCPPRLIFGDAESVGSRFHALRARTHFRRYRVRRVPFSCFVLPDSFWAVLNASGPVFIFCPPELVFGGTEDVGSRFHVLRARTRFQWSQGRQVPFSYSTSPDSFSSVPRALSPVFKFCAPGHVLGGAECVGCIFHIFARPDSFLAMPSALGPVFMFCAPGLVFGGIEGVGSRFHVLPARTSFRRYRERRVPFSCFVLPGSFFAVPNASGPVSCFARPNSFSAVSRSSVPFFMFCVTGLVFGGIECVGSRFHVLCSQTRFRRYQGRRVPFSCFARPDSFFTVTRVWGPVFMFCIPGLIFVGIEGGAECVGSRLHILHAQIRFRRCRGRRVPFSCFALPNSFWAVPNASGPVFLFCPPKLIFGGT